MTFDMSLDYEKQNVNIIDIYSSLKVVFCVFCVNDSCYDSVEHQNKTLLTLLLMPVSCLLWQVKKFALWNKKDDMEIQRVWLM